MNIPSLDFNLGETIEALRDTVQAFAAKEIAPRAAAVDRDNLFPADLWKKLGDLGLHGMTAPEEYGGTNMGYLAHIIALEEVSRASASVGLKPVRQCLRPPLTWACKVALPSSTVITHRDGIQAEQPDSRHTPATAYPV